MEKSEQLRNEYSSLDSWLQANSISEADRKRFHSAVTNTCVYIWGADPLYAPSYREAVYALYQPPYYATKLTPCEEDTFRSWLKRRSLYNPEKKSELQGYAFQNAILLPQSLLSQLMHLDQLYGTSSINEFIHRLESLLTTIITIEEDVTEGEKKAGTEVMEAYYQCCLSPSVYRPGVPLEHWEYFSSLKPTKLSKSSYTTNLEGTSPEKELKAVGAVAEEPSASLQELLQELDELTGLTQVKKDIHQLTSLLQVQKERENRGMSSPTMTLHLVFTGNPGTGKTTIARLIAKIYYEMGILSKGQLVETSRSNLIAGYQGQTAILTQEVINSALGGVLFIDEAYSLNNGEHDTYGQECIQTVLKNMEDHRKDLIVIVAGYDDLMHEFIESNPGLKSRFNKYFHFEDYSGEELFLIFRGFCKKNGYQMNRAAESKAKMIFQELYDTRDDNFGNARTARNLFEHAVNAQAMRLTSGKKIEEVSDAILCRITDKDLEHALEALRSIDEVMKES